MLGAIVALLGTGISASAETAPIAVNDRAETDGKTLQIYVLANDSGDIDPSTLVLVTQPTQGSASVIATGSPKIKYSPTGSGTDTFQYAVCNSSGACSTASVTVELSAVTTTTEAAATTTTLGATPATTVTSPVPPTLPSSVTSTPPTTLTVTPSSLTPPTTVPPSAPTNSGAQIDPFLALTVSSGQVLAAAGTLVGEPYEIDIAEDVRFLGRSGVDTLKLVAVPAVMVSGIIGFLLVGLPQNALGGLLGFLVAKRRRNRKKERLN